MKIHGSALEYTVKPHPERFLPYAREGIAAAAGVLVGSGHSAASLWRALDDPALPARRAWARPAWTRRSSPPSSGARAAAEACGRLAADLRAGPRTALELGPRPPRRQRECRSSDSPTQTGPRAVFVGKLIVSKGIDLLLAGWPLVHAANPGARLLVVGFGEYQEASRRLWAALERRRPRQTSARSRRAGARSRAGRRRR